MASTIWLALLGFAMGFCTSLGGRDQRLVSALRDSFGASLPLLLTAWFCAFVSACVMAWAGHSLGIALIGLEQGEAVLFGTVTAVALQLLFGAIVLLGTAVQLFWPVSSDALREPTRSLGALSIVMLMRQIFDPPRLTIFIIAMVLGAPLLLGFGGAIGACAALFIGWRRGNLSLHRLREGRLVQGLRMAAGAVIVVMAFRFFMIALGLA
ncbi:hypothetical protein [Qipengyuania sp. DGS5-3]|uniref:hypothetical protein n=1 Tax=Qipengyuania sp. DGS5-3 TaxID=3349632 RepID=UPI0036D2BF0A